MRLTVHAAEDVTDTSQELPRGGEPVAAAQGQSVSPLSSFSFVALPNVFVIRRLGVRSVLTADGADRTERYVRYPVVGLVRRSPMNSSNGCTKSNTIPTRNIVFDRLRRQSTRIEQQEVRTAIRKLEASGDLATARDTSDYHSVPVRNDRPGTLSQPRSDRAERSQGEEW